MPRTGGPNNGGNRLARAVRQAIDAQRAGIAERQHRTQPAELEDHDDRPLRHAPYVRPGKPARGNAVDVRLQQQRPHDDRPARSAVWQPMDPAQIVRPADRIPVKPITERLAEGQPVVARIRNQDVRGLLAGFDHKGRAVLLDQAGQRRIAEDWREMRPDGPAQPLTSSLLALPPGAVVAAPASFAAAMDAALSKQVVGRHTARAYVDAIAKAGYEVFVVGGAVRDAVHLLFDDPNASQDALLEVMHDVDLVTTAPPSTVRRICEAIAPELKKGGVWSPPAVEQFGAVLAGGKKSGVGEGEGIDIATLKAARVDGTPRPELDVNEQSFHATFTHDLLRDARARDFCCNALYYDPINRAVVDPTGMGIADAEQLLLHIAPAADVLEDKTLTPRFWKFRLRGYEADGATLVRIRRHAERAFDLVDGKARWELASSFGRAAPKDLVQPHAVQDHLDAIKKVMTEDGCGDLFDREMVPRMRGFVVAEVLKRTRKRT